MYDVHENKLYLDTIYQGAIPALTLARQLAIPQRVGQTCSILAGFWFLSGNYTKALQYCDSGLAAIDRRVDTRNLNALTTKKSDIYFELHDFKNSKLYADSSLYCAQQDDNTMQIISAHERLYYIEKNIGNLPKALKHLEIFKTLNDSMLSVEKAEVTNELEQKYNKVSNEKKIKELSHTQEINSLRTKIIVVAALLIIMFILIVFQQRFSNTRMRIYEAEQRLNRARMNPHFFFNALASLQNFSLDDGNKEMITLYISKLSKIMRQSLESTFTEFVSVENEIDFLKNYSMLPLLFNLNSMFFNPLMMNILFIFFLIMLQ
jgi:tetratricopeptide (TPR) repeat protein